MADLKNLEDARSVVYRSMAPTPQYAWPLLAEALGSDIVVKHENHTPIGAFKVRGGLVYLDRLKQREPDMPGIISATRGNHGQSLAFAARAAGIACTVVVPHGNSREKNAAMRGFGAKVVEHGRDFDDARVQAQRLAEERSLHMVPSFHEDLVAGVGSYAMELMEAEPDLARIYVPIGLGSGICGLIAARDALGRNTEIIGVVPETAAAYALSFEAGRVIETNSAMTFADGTAVRIPDAGAFETIHRGAERIVTITDDDIADAVRLYFRATHSIAEGAGAAPLAAALKEQSLHKDTKTAVILTGQNIDTDWYAALMAGETPQPR